MRGKTMSRVGTIIGDSWGLRIVLIAAVCLYLGLAIADFTAAGKAVATSIGEMKKLMIPLIVAIFVGGAVKNLVTPEVVSKLFGGGKAGAKGVLSAGAVGSLLPPCPFVAYPVMKGFRDAGVGFPHVMTMLVAATMVEVGQVFCGLVVFGAYVVGVQILFAFIGVMIIGFLFHSLCVHFPESRWSGFGRLPVHPKIRQASRRKVSPSAQEL